MKYKFTMNSDSETSGLTEWNISRI